jgi:hypothetical protein
MSGVDENGNIILPSGQAYNPQMAVQDTLSNLYGMSQGIPYIPMPQYEISPEFGVNRFLTGQEAMPLVFDVSAPQYTPDYEPFVYTPKPFNEFKKGQSQSDNGPGGGFVFSPQETAFWNDGGFSGFNAG